ncbi:Gfo/Idh/MocA family protein [Oerskovia flava]|uniref:Gfo/Idh/MocA family protein n=1 Tax=Oerskovia flava TaxID=2986422 RepID=UPI00223F90BF|nr:Gfo/Idh/MocA family oxidoreductase [Oerskovia sp. JB1-3-2]
MTPPHDPVGITLVGTGAFAREHLTALATLPGADVRWVVGHDLRRARDFAALTPGARATTDLAEALADDRAVAVDVVTATPTHARDTVAAGEAGRHVQVEKPAALSLPQLDAMVRATHGTSLVVGQTVRFQPAVAALAAASRRGEIGTPRLAHVSWYTGHAWPGGWRGWQLDPELSGGHPVHNGTHIMDLATWLLDDEPAEVFARGFRTFSPDMDSPDSFHVQLRTASGALATLELCYALQRRGDLLRRVVLVGTEGTLAHTTAEEDGLHSDAATAPPPSVDGALRTQLAHWLDVVRGDAAPLVTTAQVRAALATALAAQRSLLSGRRERVRDVPGYDRGADDRGADDRGAAVGAAVVA